MHDAILPWQRCHTMLMLAAMVNGNDNVKRYGCNDLISKDTHLTMGSCYWGTARRLFCAKMRLTIDFVPTTPR